MAITHAHRQATLTHHLVSPLSVLNSVSSYLPGERESRRRKAVECGHQQSVRTENTLNARLQGCKGVITREDQPKAVCIAMDECPNGECVDQVLLRKRVREQQGGFVQYTCASKTSRTLSGMCARATPALSKPFITHGLSGRVLSREQSVSESTSRARSRCPHGFLLSSKLLLGQNIHAHVWRIAPRHQPGTNAAVPTSITTSDRMCLARSRADIKGGDVESRSAALSAVEGGAAKLASSRTRVS